MSNIVVSPEELINAIVEITDDYAVELRGEMFQDINAAALQCKKDIVAASPVRTGAYKSGWTKSKIDNNGLVIGFTIHNTKKPSLCHLLEKGHGGPHPAGAKPHIAPAADKASAYLLGRMR